MMRAVDAVMECLKAEGVDVVFGYPGGANLPTYDAFVDAGIRHILVRHEAGGGHAAEGYAKASGKVVKLHDALCTRCGTELDFPDVAIASEADSARRRLPAG